MTFKIIENPKFTVPVEVPMPGGDTQDLVATFVGISEDAFNEMDWVGDGSKDSVRQIVESFRDVEDADGKTLSMVPVGDPVFEQLLSMPNVRVALWRGYAQAMAGLKGPRRGN